MMSKKEREEKNFNKRKIFWDKIKNVRLDFDANKLSINDFIKKFGEQIDSLREKCEKTIPYCKGKATIKYLKLISDDAKKLSDQVRNGVDGDFFTERSPNNTYLIQYIDELSSILIKTSKARFPFLVNPSTLDFDLTRNEFKRLSEELNTCKLQIFALSNKYQANKLVNYVEQHSVARINCYGRSAPKFCFIDINGNGLPIYHGDFITRQTLGMVPKNMDKFKKVLDCSEEKRKLEEIIVIMHARADKKDPFDEDYKKCCDNCKKTFYYYDVIGHYRKGYPHSHYLCKECLLRVVANKYKCPVCGEKLDKQWVLRCIKELS